MVGAVRPMNEIVELSLAVHERYERYIWGLVWDTSQ